MPIQTMASFLNSLSGRLLMLAAVALAIGAAVAVSGLGDSPEAKFSAAAGPRVPVKKARATFYVDAVRGSDRSTGRSADKAWRTPGRASVARLEPGDHLLFRRGQSWKGSLRLTRSGTPGRRILVGAYGKGEAPRLTQGQRIGEGACVLLTGSDLHVRDLRVAGCRPARAGVESVGDRNIIERIRVSENEAGIVIGAGADQNRVVSNVLRDNKLMTVNDCGGDDDYGAYSIAVEGASRTEVAYNYAEGAVGASCDYGEDGSMVELFRSGDAFVHHNVSRDNQTFVEVGGEGSEGSRFAYNRVFSSQPKRVGFVVHGGGGFGGASRISLDHNTVRLTGADSLGLLCNQACSPQILRARDNVFAAVKPAESPGPFDDDANFYSGRVKFRLGPNSVIGDPQFTGPTGVKLAPESPAADLGALPVGGS